MVILCSRGTTTQHTMRKINLYLIKNSLCLVFCKRYFSYIFDYVTIVGNSENTTDYQTLAGVTIGLNGDNTRTQATFTPGATNTVYKIRVTPQDNDLAGAVANYIEQEVQSATTAVTHQPGTIYEGGSGFAGQVLLVNDFSHASYQRADAGDSVGYVTAVKLTFPAGKLKTIKSNLSKSLYQHVPVSASMPMLIIATSTLTEPSLIPIVSSSSLKLTSPTNSPAQSRPSVTTSPICTAVSLIQLSMLSLLHQTST